MILSETGAAIAALRRKAGLTQSSLAEAIGVSDKAVSKWERGIACPDISFLPKLSVLLDTDIESLLNGSMTSRAQRWKGLLILDEFSSSTVYTKPLVYFLLSNFMLVGIRDILIVGGDVQSFLGTGTEYGLRLTYSNRTVGEAVSNKLVGEASGVLVIYGNVLIYGGSLTSRYQGVMSFEDGARQLASSSGAELPIIFCTANRWTEVACQIVHWKDGTDIKRSIKPTKKKLGRGVVCLPMTDHKEILEASLFVRIIEENCSEKIADLEELASNRVLVKI